jgi:hypothetical protein
MGIMESAKNWIQTQRDSHTSMCRSSRFIYHGTGEAFSWPLAMTRC